MSKPVSPSMDHNAQIGCYHTLKSWATRSLTAGLSHANFIVVEGPMLRGALGLIFNILNHFISELVFWK